MAKKLILNKLQKIDTSQIQLKSQDMFDKKTKFVH
jgi:hypothetical protein